MFDPVYSVCLVHLVRGIFERFGFSWDHFSLIKATYSERAVLILEPASWLFGVDFWLKVLQVFVIKKVEKSAEMFSNPENEMIFLRLLDHQ